MQKKILTYAFIFSAILLLNIGCDDNSRSLGNFGIDIATVIPDGADSYSLLLDNGKKLWPAASTLNFMPATNHRVLLNYTILSEKKDHYDHYIKVNDLWNILTKQIISLTPQNEDSIGNDPVKTNAVWVGGDYLNVSFHFNYGGDKPHFINLVESKKTSQTESEIDSEVIELELRHNSYNSDSDRLYEGFVCFDLRSLQRNDVDSVKISVRVNEWNDKTDNNIKENIFEVIYRYGNSGNVHATSEMPIPVIASNEYY